MALDSVTTLLATLDARLVVTIAWRGGQLDRLLDEGHAGVVARVAALLQASGWEIVPEATYAIYGERGSIDILAWEPRSRTLLVVEVKTEISSAEELLRRHDAKVRLAPAICRDRFGVPPAAVGRLLVVADTSTNRRRVARLDSVLSPVYRLRGAALREWLRRPAGSIGGLLFIDPLVRGPGTARGGARRRRAT
jgi:hypothetical protein